ncbi:MAG: MazG nucleotide pyrophosphohydrolase domain-containing protein [Candidatus Woesearchaeota archaeon]|jgi:uncharacterized protein YabN with tetrapyrrole methylase and pyrophosphatase domain
MATFDEVIGVAKRLRKECPWDAQQTFDGFHRFILEEAQEFEHAVQHESKEEIKEELGDVFWNCCVLTTIAESEGLFTMDELLETIKTKMIRRHPHVYGTEPKTLESIHQKWQEIKVMEKAEKAKRKNETSNTRTM